MNIKTALTFLALLLCVNALPACAQGLNDLSIRVTLKHGERSKDSSSQTTTITVTGDAIVWEKTFSGHRSRIPPPERKEFALSAADKSALLKVIESENLLVTDSIQLPEDPSSYSYFEISIGLALADKKGAIRINGPMSADKVKDEVLYQHTLALVKELYRILHSQDRSIYLEGLPPDR